MVLEDVVLDTSQLLVNSEKHLISPEMLKEKSGSAPPPGAEVV